MGPEHEPRLLEQRTGGTIDAAGTTCRGCAARAEQRWPSMGAGAVAIARDTPIGAYEGITLPRGT